MKGSAFNVVVVSVATCVSLATLNCSTDEELHARVESLERENAQLAEKVTSLEASVKTKEGLLEEQTTKIQALEQANIELKSEVEVFRGYFQKREDTAQPDSLSSVLEEMDASALSALGTPFKEKGQTLYSGKLRIKAYAHGFICANERGETEIVTLKDKGLRLPPHGIIGNIFDKQGGSKVFGNPIEGALCVFDGEYRLHVFEKSVIFWNGKRGTQSAIFSSKFRRREGKISQPDSFSSVLKEMDVNALSALGTPFSEKEQTLYSGKLRVKAYTRGFICANEQDETEVVILKEKNPHLPPFGHIKKVFRKQGGSRIFGSPIEGEHRIYDDEYRLHVFGKAVIFWSRKRGTQSAIFSSRFR